MIERLLEEIRDWLGNMVVSEKELEDCLSEREFSSDEISYIKGEMLKSGFSFINDKVCYRGDYVVKMPPNQNPVSQEDLIKKCKRR